MKRPIIDIDSHFLDNKFMPAKKFRHEYKYVSPEYILLELEQRVKSLLALDSHTGPSGCYNIRSIYFDDMYNTCYYENEDGTDPREKFRIRIYNRSEDRISLELKRKERGKCLKTSALMSLEMCREIMEGNIPALTGNEPYLIKKLVMEMQAFALRPKVIVEYDRVPFIWKEGNVRITFDRNIRSASSIQDFFSENLASRPVMAINTNMIEVKFDEFLPDFINELLQTGRLEQTSFSKYYLCRKYSKLGAAYVF